MADTPPGPGKLDQLQATLKQVTTQAWLSSSTSWLHTLAQIEKLGCGVSDQLMGRTGATRDLVNAFQDATQQTRGHLLGLLQTQIAVGKKLSEAHGALLSHAVDALLGGLRAIDPAGPAAPARGGARPVVREVLDKLRHGGLGGGAAVVDRPAPIAAELRCLPDKGGEVTVKLKQSGAADLHVSLRAGVFHKLPDRHDERDVRLQAAIEFDPAELTLRPGADEPVRIRVPWDERFEAGRRYKLTITAVGLGQRIDLLVIAGGHERHARGGAKT
jgi:hypothetical protein